jgi:prevent-host-death family protein
METNHTNATEAKLHFGEILNRAVYAEQPTIVTRHGKPVAIIASIKEWENRSEKPGKKNSGPSWLRKMTLVQNQIEERRKRLGIKATSDSVQLIRELRDSR